MQVPKSERAPDGSDPEVATYADVTRALAERSAVVLDVLPRKSFRQRHIPGARNLPLGELEARAERVLRDRGREVLVHCAGYT